MLDMLDLVGVITEKAIQPMQSITNTKVGYIGLPYPLFWSKANNSKERNSLIELGNMSIGCGVPFNLAVFKNLDFDGICYPHNNEDKETMRYLTHNRLQFGKIKGWQDYYREHSSNFLGIHMDMRFSVGRFSMDCAAANIPLVGTPYSQAQEHLFPETSIKHYEIDKAVNLVKRLYSDSNFYDRVVEYANEKIKDFDIEITKQRFLNLL